MIDGQCWIGVSDGTSIVSIVGNEAVLLMEGLGGDVFRRWSVRHSVVGLRVSLMIYIRSWFVVGVVPHNRYSSLLFNHS